MSVYCGSCGHVIGEDDEVYCGSCHKSELDEANETYWSRVDRLHKKITWLRSELRRAEDWYRQGEERKCW